MRKVCSLVILTGAFGSAVLAQNGGSASVSAEMKQAYATVKNNILKSAEKVPDADYSFKPTPEIRSFAEVLAHVADSQARTCSAISGEHAQANAAGKTSKADIIAALQAAFAVCDKAYDSLTDSNASEAITTPRGQRTKIGALAGNLSHDSEQYGIMSVYMRLKNIVPPSSDRSGR
ncbi:MAG: DinB family protein [Acidobacteriaceae bacterium]|nr:DinB family protein [Acidobacteriaceae bacterium]